MAYLRDALVENIQMVLISQINLDLYLTIFFNLTSWLSGYPPALFSRGPGSSHPE
jgi:hypothetical protein